MELNFLITQRGANFVDVKRLYVLIAQEISFQQQLHKNHAPDHVRDGPLVVVVTCMTEAAMTL